MAVSVTADEDEQETLSVHTAQVIIHALCHDREEPIIAFGYLLAL